MARRYVTPMTGCWTAAVMGTLLSSLTCGASEPIAPREQEETLTFVQQVRQLTLEDAGQAIPLELRGVVTYYDPSRLFGFIQDQSGGVHFVGQRQAENATFDWPEFSPGDRIELSGITARGNFSPFVGIPSGRREAVRVVETASFPSPVVLPVGRLLNPGYHNQFCEVAAILTDVRRTRSRICLTLNSGGLQYQGFIPHARGGEARLKQWMFAEVRVRGVYGALFDNQGQMVGLEFFVPKVDSIEPSGLEAGQLFDQEPTSLQDLLRFRDQTPERLLVEGVVLLQLPGRGLYLRSEERGLWVETDVERSLAPGDTVRAVGRPTPGELRPYLSDAIVQFQECGKVPAPRLLDSSQALSPDAESDLVQVTARLVDSVDLPNGRLLLLQGDNVTFTARCPNSTTTSWPKLAPGAWLELTGVCVVKADGTWRPDRLAIPNQLSRTPASFTLLLRDLSDVSLLHEPSWWTFRRLALLAGTMALVAALAFAWVGLLRYRLRQQTSLMAETVERESIQQERTRIARDLHDTLQQNLTGILHQLHCVTRRVPESADRARESLTLAKGMIQHSLEEVRGVIWNLRSEAFRRTDLNVALSELVTPFLDQEKPRVYVHTPSITCSFPGVIQHHLVNIVSEALRNAMQHADANRIDVRLDTTEDQLMITVTDDGAGFDERTVDLAGGHFGLIGMRERAAKIHGEVQIVSPEDRGTCVTVRIPLPNDARQGGTDG